MIPIDKQSLTVSSGACKTWGLPEKSRGRVDEFARKTLRKRIKYVAL